MNNVKKKFIGHISILLCGDIEFDSRVKRISSYISSEFESVTLHFLDRPINGPNTNNSSKNINNFFSESLLDGLKIKSHKLQSDFLPKGGKWGYIKYAEFFFKALIGTRKSDLIYCNDIATLPVAYFLKIFKPKLKIIYDTHELAPYKGTPSKFKIKLRAFIESILIKKANFVFTVSNRIATWYRRLYKLNYIHPIYNSPLPSKTSKNIDIFDEDQSSVNFVWHGILAKNRGIETVLEVFKEKFSKPVKVTFIGWGDLEGVIKASSNEYESIIHKPPMSQKKLLEYIIRFNCGLFTYQPTSKNYDWAMPNKFFEYSSAALPIISFPLTESKKTLQKYKFGLVCNDFSKEALVNSIEEFINTDRNEIKSFKINAINFLESNSWKIQQDKILDCFNKIN